MKSRLYFVFLFLLWGVMPLKAKWQRPITNYTRHIYKAENQNWMLQQHENGWMYVANNNGLLEFDGTGWNLYPLQNVKARAMKIGHDGRIYIGGIGRFGYFVPNRLGGLDYTCLSAGLPPNSVVGVIWNIHQDKDRIYFQSDRGLFCWEDNRLEYIESAGEIYTSAILYDKFYIGAAEGIQVMEGKRFKLVSGSETLGRVSALLPYNGEILIVTRNNGLFMYDGVTVRKYTCAADGFMRRNRIFCAVLDRSLLALGSVQDGVCLLDLERDEMNVISINNGLQNKTVLGMSFDARGDLWLGLDNGIDCVHLSSPVLSLYGNKPVIGSGYASSLYQDRLYLGTNQGLYATVPPQELNKEMPMELVPGTGGQIWSLLTYDNKLFCASDNGVFVLEGDKIELLDGLRGVRMLAPLKSHPEVLIAGTYGKNSGLYLLKKEMGRWQVACRIKNFTYAVKSLMAEDSGTVLWVTNKERGVCRLTLSDDLCEVRNQKNYNGHSFPTGYDSFVGQTNNEIVVASHYGLWHYNSVKDSLEECRELENLMDGKAAYTYLAMDMAHNLWYVSGGVLKLLRYDAGKNSYAKDPGDVFLKGSLIENCEHVEVYGGQAIVGTEEGFSMIRLLPVVAGRGKRSLQIRRVYLTDRKDSLIYGRSYQYEDTLVVIPYEHNSLRIEYNVNGSDAVQSSLFSYRLSKEGDKGEWSEFCENRVKEFTGLHEGQYVFSVRLQANGEEEASMASFTFKVLPPWYRTWWSYLAYALAVLLLSYGIYHRVVSSRKHLLMQKELELYRQQQEFKKESEQKDRTIDSLKEEKLQAELRHKSEELVHTTLNIVRKNEMLLELRKGVEGISHSLNEDDPASLRRRIVRLQGQITTNIEHDEDLQAFQSTFDSVHHGFFKHLEGAYPDLTHKEKLLCAYIKMNLLTKEIAPLLNISVRGVEISRYRLRKKLGLEERDNLTEFLQRFSQVSEG